MLKLYTGARGYQENMSMVARSLTAGHVGCSSVKVSSSTRCVVRDRHTRTDCRTLQINQPPEPELKSFGLVKGEPVFQSPGK